jgi:hypothetical protein
MRFYGFSLLWSTRRSLIKFFMTFQIGSEGCIFSCFISIFHVYGLTVSLFLRNAGLCYAGFCTKKSY